MPCCHAKGSSLPDLHILGVVAIDEIPGLACTQPVPNLLFTGGLQTGVVSLTHKQIALMAVLPDVGAALHAGPDAQGAVGQVVHP